MTSLTILHAHKRRTVRFSEAHGAQIGEMNAEIIINIPDWFAEQLGPDIDTRRRFALEAIAIHAYRERRSGARELASVLGLTYIGFERFLCEKQIPSNRPCPDLAESLKRQEKFFAPK